MITVSNEDARPKDYEHMRTKFRPSHADYTYQAKYGIRNWMGGGRASARETIGRVAAGAIAKKVLKLEHGVEIVGYVKQVWQLVVDIDSDTVSSAEVASNIVRCPDPDMAAQMIERIKEARKTATRWGAWSRRWLATCRPAWASRCSTSSTPTWPGVCSRCPRARGSRSAPGSVV